MLCSFTTSSFELQKEEMWTHQSTSPKEKNQIKFEKEGERKEKDHIHTSNNVTLSFRLLVFFFFTFCFLLFLLEMKYVKNLSTKVQLCLFPGKNSNG